MFETAYSRLSDRFDEKVIAEAGCWVWTSARDGKGYGLFWYQGRSVRAHRMAWFLAGLHVPQGLVLDHKCRNPACVNPAHLEPVTNRENTLRGNNRAVLSARWATITECPRGHPYSPENTYRTKSGTRSCKECKREANRQWKRRQRDAR